MSLLLVRDLVSLHHRNLAEQVPKYLQMVRNRGLGQIRGWPVPGRHPSSPQ